VVVLLGVDVVDVVEGVVFVESGPSPAVQPATAPNARARARARVTTGVRRVVMCLSSISSG